LFADRIIPYRGSWLDFEFDAMDLIHVRIDRRRKIHVTTLLLALDNDATAKKRAAAVSKGQTLDPAEAQGLSPEEILSAIYVEAGQEITQAVLDLFDENEIDVLPTLAIDHVNVGPYIRNTLAADKNSNREEALLDIYRVMRPGEPPTLEQAETLFQGLLFDIDRYDLSPVGRVKMNMRLEFDGVPDSQRTLRREDILAVVKVLHGLKDGRGEIDDIDHLGNRRVRSVGELMENQ